MNFSGDEFFGDELSGDELSGDEVYCIPPASIKVFMIDINS